MRKSSLHQGPGRQACVQPVLRSCGNSEGGCSAPFEITQQDQTFFQKLAAAAPELRSIPPPTLCPDCRQQRRLARRNERVYYRKKCDLCKKEGLSIYPADAPYVTYCTACWWSDRWDPISYGRDVDFSRPFFDQFQEFQEKVPRLALFGRNNVNCDYVNHAENDKNCYLCNDIAHCEDVFFSKWMITCQDCADCYQLEKSNRCFESQYSVGMHNNIYTFWGDQSSNLAFCYDCEGCSDCLLCTHLRHKRFCIENTQYSEEEYRKRMQQIDLRSHSQFSALLQRYHAMWEDTYHRQHQYVNATNCSGDYLYNCENIHQSFGVIESKDCAYCYDAGHMQDCQDAYEPAFDCELQYDSHGCNRGKRILSCSVCYDIVGCAYCDMCYNVSHLLGCISLRRKEYCILNKQYTKEQYEKLVPRLIEHMQKTGEWGEFFSVALSPFSYNETLAQEYEPLTMEEVQRRGWRWKEQKDDVSNVTKVIPANRLPDHINDIPDDILNWAIRCEATGRPFRIVKQELNYYREMKLPVPRLHPDERHRRRMAFTNPRKLWQRQCAKCGENIETTYTPERPERVYCQECYLKEVY